MSNSTPRLTRCAVYTRKSTEHNLDLAFTSLDAQREACEAYIRSQAGEGWRPVPGRYDDGGLSGASLDRPALQALLAAVQARSIDVVVVYKVDRLTRSLADFAKLIELFDAHAVSFVSVTQSFNTTTSMGRLTLNILLSFAQFEREVIGERVRDKIAASKRKGIWVGGPVPLGYAAVDKRVVVLPGEAEAVREIFARYLAHGSVQALAQELDRDGIRSKQRKLATGRIIGGGAFGVGALAYLLHNRFYIGEVVYRGETFRGDHQPILDAALFAAVQERLAAQAVVRRCRIRGSPALLTGRLFDRQGHRMTPTHTNKKGVRYSYYVSQALLRKRSAGSIGRAPAAELETAVVDAIRRHLQEDGRDPNPIPEAGRELIEQHLLKATLNANDIVLHLRSNVAGNAAAGQEICPRTATTITIPWTLPTVSPVKGIAHVPAHNTPMKPGRRELTAIAKARGWIRDVERGQSFADIARREAKAERHIRHLAPLAFVSPRIVAAILEPGSHATSRRNQCSTRILTDDVERATPLFGTAGSPSRRRGASVSTLNLSCWPTNVPKNANTEALNAHLAAISSCIAEGSHAALLLDGAGWHVALNLVVPENITLIHLPPYSPELNPVENVWQYLRQNKLALRVHETYDDIVEACCKAWNDLMAMPDRIATITTRQWATVS